jgi:hypothetical protein
MTRRLIWLTVFALTMAYIESAVVVYLRELYYPEGFRFPIVIIIDRVARGPIAGSASCSSASPSASGTSSTTSGCGSSCAGRTLS